MCVSCREGKPKQELLRVVKKSNGMIEIDPGGKAEGRGAYVCMDVKCIENACKKKAFSRAFKMNVPDGVYQTLMERVDQDGE